MPQSLRTRFVLMSALLFALVLTLAAYASHWYTNEITATIGEHYAERNAAYEKSRFVQVIARELTLAQKMASSPVLKEWIHDEADVARRQRAVAELEDYRLFFRGHSYFMAIGASGNYYYNDERGGHDLIRPRYTLSRTIAKDTWFYATLGARGDQLLNVDTDRHLGVTRVWVNTVVRDAAGRGIAVTGTGLDLTEFIAAVVSSRQPGIVNLLLDEHGAIQAHPDASVIDYASIRKAVTSEKRSTVFGMLDTAADAARLTALLARLRSGELDSGALSVRVSGQKRLLGATYVPEIGWHVVSLIDPEIGVDARILPYGALLILASLIAAIAMLAIVLNRQVVARLSRLNQFAERIGAGEYTASLPDRSTDEIGRLTRTMETMGQQIASHTETLEAAVTERTAELQRLARTDYLTGLLNRRGMVERLHIESQRLTRKEARLGMLLIDIDWFKRVNDTLGHEAGDLVITHVASLIAANVRAYDLCARWGGEEFLVALPEVSGVDELLRIADKLLGLIRSRPLALPPGASRTQTDAVPVTVSIGVGWGAGDEPLDAIIQRADRSLYEAKMTGRDRLGKVFTGSQGAAQ